jgi:hypothetical protein
MKKYKRKGARRMGNRRYVVLPIKHSKMYEEISQEALKKISFNGTPKKITDDYWSAYIYAFNSFIEKRLEELMHN